MAHPGGRPRKFQNVEEMSSKIDEYFENAEIYTISGLCIYLDILSETLCEYEKLEEFSATIKKAKKKIENFAEEKLFKSGVNAAGVIFNLKNNFGWKDKQEIESTNTNLNQNIDDMSIEEVRARIAELQKIRD